MHTLSSVSRSSSMLSFECAMSKAVGSSVRKVKSHALNAGKTRPSPHSQDGNRLSNPQLWKWAEMGLCTPAVWFINTEKHNQVKNLTRDRLNTFNGGHYSDVNLSTTLFVTRTDAKEHVKLLVWSAPGLTKPSFEEAMKQDFKEAKKGDRFGPSCELQQPRSHVQEC